MPPTFAHTAEKSFLRTREFLDCRTHKNVLSCGIEMRASAPLVRKKAIAFVSRSDQSKPRMARLVKQLVQVMPEVDDLLCRVAPVEQHGFERQFDAVTCSAPTGALCIRCMPFETYAAACPKLSA